jgi:hypothetical protein
LGRATSSRRARIGIVIFQIAISFHFNHRHYEYQQYAYEANTFGNGVATEIEDQDSRKSMAFDFLTPPPVKLNRNSK